MRSRFHAFALAISGAAIMLALVVTLAPSFRSQMAVAKTMPDAPQASVVETTPIVPADASGGPEWSPRTGDGSN
jgi:hypothetical protein